MPSTSISRRPVAADVAAVTEVQPLLIASIRIASLQCRVESRLAPSAACRLLHPETNAGEFADALVRTLPNLMLRRPRVLAPGCQTRSFDENWLLALSEAIRRGDRHSRAFLLRRRTRPGSDEVLTLMVSGLNDRLDNL